MPLLTKSLFLSGLQCPKRLWWQAHEPDAPELAPTADQQARFEAGRLVGDVARGYVPGGATIGYRRGEIEEQLAATRNALAAGARVLYEGAVAADGAYAAVDILEAGGDGFRVIEVKSSTSVKSEHLPDVALQVHLARTAGLAVSHAEVMHLNRECRHPDLTNLFVRADVGEQIAHWLPQVGDLIAAQRAVLDGPLPEIAIGDRCFEPYECPFIQRCWPRWPADHISSLYHSRRRALELEAEGYRSLHDLPGALTLNAVQLRQVRAVQTGSLVIEPGLVRSLEEFEGPLAFLDFESVAPAIPLWPGCRPWDNVPVLFSVQREEAGGWRNVAWLAEGPHDPRPELARRLLAACEGVRSVVAYHAAFERDCIRTVAAGAPELAPGLGELELKLRDLLPAVRNHVYHPRFGGSFSLKSVLSALVPELTYDDLEIRDGARATVELWRLMFEADRLASRHKDRLRHALLRYCERDTLALLRLLERLRELAAAVALAPDAAEGPAPAAAPEPAPVLLHRAGPVRAAPARPGPAAIQLDLGL